MKNVIKTAAYTAVTGASLASAAFASTNNVVWSTTRTGTVWDSRTLLNQQGAADLGMSGKTGSIGDSIVAIMQYLLGFMALIAVIFAIYATILYLHLLPNIWYRKSRRYEIYSVGLSIFKI